MSDFANSTYAEPGVRVVHGAARSQPTALPTALPLFAGFTKIGANEVHVLSSFPEFVVKFGEAYEGADFEFSLYDSMEHYFKVGGERCYVLSLGDYGSYVEFEGLLKALKSVEWEHVWAQAPQCTLLSVPDLSMPFPEGYTEWATTLAFLLSPSVRPEHLFVVLDLPDNATDATGVAAALVAVLATPSEHRSHGALYWPPLITYSAYQANPANPKSIPCSSAVIAMMQRTDRERGVWKAPANEELPEVLRPTQLTKLSLASPSASLNRIRPFQHRGVRVWGDQTLLSSDESASNPWRYVQVRRTASYVQASLREVVRFALFEPNNEMTWLRLEGVIRVWLRRLWKVGGLAGAVEADAFTIKIGVGVSMTPTQLDEGLLIIQINLAFYAPAEFIELQLQLHTGETQILTRLSTPNRSEVVS